MALNFPTITFNDGVSATLTATTIRFSNWVPRNTDIGPSAVTIGDGATYKTIYRTDYTATFDVTNITTSQLSVAMRLMRHLEAGNSINITTFDKNAATYTCSLAPGTNPSLGSYDKQMMEFTLTLPVKNNAAADLTVKY